MSVINQVLKDLDSRDKMTDEKPVEHYAVQKNPDSVDSDWLRTGIWSLLLILILSVAAYYYVLTQQAQAPVFYQPVTATLDVEKNKPEETVQQVSQPEIAQAIAQNNVEDKPASLQPETIQSPEDAKLSTAQSEVTVEKQQPVLQQQASEKQTKPSIAYLPLKDDGKAIEPVKPSSIQPRVASQSEPGEVKAEIKIVKSEKKPIDQARDLITGGRLVEAESLLKQIVQGKQYIAPAYELLTAVQLRSNRLSDATATLNKALKIYPYNTNLNLMQARIFVNQGKNDLAVSLLEKQLQNGKPSVKTIAMLAPLYQNQKKYSAAAGLYRQLVSSQPKLGQNWMGLATNLDALGDYKNALQAYQRAVQLGLNSVALQKYANERMRKLAQQAGANAGT